MLDKQTKKQIIAAQRDEITHHVIYTKLANAIKNEDNRKLLKHIANDELKHYTFWKEITKKEVRPKRITIWWYYVLSKIFGITFGIKLMEGGEKQSQERYKKIFTLFPEAQKFVAEEDQHEQKLIDMIGEEKLKYIGSMVLGLNDALVELTGALAGLTLALQNAKLIGAAGFITGIAASLSMGASEYLSTRAEGGKRNPLTAAIYTGVAYVSTVLFLIFPYLIVNNIYISLGWAIFNALIVISIFTFYVSTVKTISFKKRFIEMAGLSLSIALFTFIIGFLVRTFLNIEV
ncbi:VIT1/CCC1 transporter family protein [Patescibacteria group bacterium AH-259-L05]|nr:VIT1/CCC1 transporter family protein [Patescibacteria group bacterium AH-259-L05]